MDGIGVLINRLGGNEETVKAVQGCLGKAIASVKIESDENLVVVFTNEGKLTLRDDGQSCCESRYMRTDDDPKSIIGAELTSIELREAPSVSEQYSEHDVQFLVLITTKGNFVCSNHVEHNGYYGGFSITASYEPGR